MTFVKTRAVSFTAGLIALLIAVSARADFAGKVVAVADGDSITVMNGREQVRVRLTEIDAPENKQAFGRRARQSLSEVCWPSPNMRKGVNAPTPQRRILRPRRVSSCAPHRRLALDCQLRIIRSYT